MPRDLLPINRHKREGIAEEISHPVWVKKKKEKKEKQTLRSFPTNEYNSQIVNLSLQTIDFKQM